jgi:hypothetical protein
MWWVMPTLIRSNLPRECQVFGRLQRGIRHWEDGITLMA